jgi:hypothetical protein
MSVEDLNVRGLLANHRLGRKIAGMDFYTADSWSTKRSGTARSGARHSQSLVPEQQDVLGVRSPCGRPTVFVRVWRCAWGEINGAANLCQYALDSAIWTRSNACGEEAFALVSRAT